MQIADHIVFIDNRLWITVKCLEHFGFVLNTIKKGYKRYRSGKGSSWEPHTSEKLNGNTIIAYDSIPEDQARQVKLPSADKLITEITTSERTDEIDTIKSIADLCKPHYQPEDALWFQSRYNVNANANGRDRAKELALGCAILRLLNRYNTKAEIKEYTGFQTKSELYDAVGTWVSTYGDHGLYQMPSTYRNLRPKVREWAEADKHGDDPRLIFNLERYTENDHALKFTKEHQTTFMMYYLNPLGNKALGQKWPLLTCHQKYMSTMKYEFGLAEKECVDIGAIRAHFNKTRERKQLVNLARHGTTWFDSHVMPYIVGRQPDYSMSLIAGDGWMPGRTVITRRKVWSETKKAYVIRTRQRAVNVWIWYDWKSKAILSHYMSETETSEGIRKSFRDILSFWGVVPGSVMIDKKWMQQGDIQRLFDKAGVTIESKKPYRPEGSIAERNNKEVNKYFREEDPFWVNMDRNTHTPEFRHNENWVRNSDPVEEQEFLDTLHRIIERYNTTPLKSLNGKTPLEVLQENIHPLCRKVDPLEANFIFGDRRGPLQIRQHNFDIQIATKKYSYSIGFELKKGKVINNDDHIRFDRSVRPSEKVLIYFDEKHMDTVDVYSYTDLDDPSTHRYMMTAVNQELISVNRSSWEEHPDHRKALQDERIKRMEANYQAKLRELAEDAQEWGLIDEMEDADGNVEYDVTPLQKAGQQAEKERAQNEVSTAYKKYFSEREEDELVGAVTVPTTKSESKLSAKDKIRLMEERLEKK